MFKSVVEIKEKTCKYKALKKKRTNLTQRQIKTWNSPEFRQYHFWICQASTTDTSDGAIAVCPLVTEIVFFDIHEEKKSKKNEEKNIEKEELREEEKFHQREEERRRK